MRAWPSGFATEAPWTQADHIMMGDGVAAHQPHSIKPAVLRKGYLALTQRPGAREKSGRAQQLGGRPTPLARAKVSTTPTTQVGPSLEQCHLLS